MIKKISVTFGSRPVLVNIINKYPERDLALFSTNDDNTGLELLDHSGKEPIFKNPVVYDTLGHCGNDNWSNYIEFIHLSPSEDQKKVINAGMNQFLTNPELPGGMYSCYYLTDAKTTSDRIILTLWHNRQDYLNWIEYPNNFVAQYQSDPNINYLATGYERVSATQE